MVVEATFEKIAEIRREGIGILLVEQNVQRALAVGDREYLPNPQSEIW